MLVEKLKQLREAKGLLQRQVASKLNVDTAYISKMENNDKPVSKIHLKALSNLYSFPESKLIPLWLGEKVLNVLDNDEYKLDALNLVKNHLSKLDE